MPSCYDVAKYFLAKNDEDAGDLITNMKLQKLVYYAQGLYLAWTGESLFSESIKAWEHGPVVPQLYHEYKDYGSGAIPYPDDFDPDDYDSEIAEFLDEIYEVFGQYSAFKLRNLTHAELPWLEAYPNGTISNETMREYFKQYIQNE